MAWTTDILSISQQAQLASICRAHRVRRLALFGSVARGDARPDSDVDLLVEFEPGYTPTFFKLEALADELSPVFGERYVDFAFPESLHWFIRDRVLASARTIYER